MHVFFFFFHLCKVREHLCSYEYQISFAATDSVSVKLAPQLYLQNRPKDNIFSCLFCSQPYWFINTILCWNTIFTVILWNRDYRHIKSAVSMYADTFILIWKKMKCFFSSQWAVLLSYILNIFYVGTAI